MCIVSVIINCYNGEKFLKETLDSLSEQSFVDYEVVFVDNCSTDNSAAIAKNFGKKLKYYRTEHNVPLGEARNYALDRCNGKYIAFLDSDDLWRNDKLDLQVKSFDDNPNCVISVSNNYIYNMMTNQKTIVIKKRKSGKVDYNNFAINYKFGLSSFMIKKECLDEMTFCFDTQLSYAEEFDFFLRLACLGEVFYMDKPLSTYRLHDSMHSLKLKETIPIEYEIVRKNLIANVENFGIKYPQVLLRICFLRDYTKTKLCIEKENYIEARKIVKSYCSYNYRAIFFYLLTFFPEFLIKKIYSSFFSRKTL